MSDHVDKAQAWDAAQASWQKGYERAKAEDAELRQAASDFMLLFVQEVGDDRTLSVEDIDHQELARAYERLSAALSTKGQADE